MKRVRKSKVWDDFNDVELGYQKTLMLECMHYYAKFNKTKSSTMSILFRHIKSCHVRLQKLKKKNEQQQKKQ